VHIRQIARLGHRTKTPAISEPSLVMQLLT